VTVEQLQRAEAGREALAGRRALVTEAANGIWAAVVRPSREAGATVDCDRKVVLYEGAKVAELQGGTVSLEDIITDIVGGGGARAGSLL
jgi:hypothetical protein